MKLKIEDVEKAEFKPIKIEITVESVRDARLLFHVFNNCNLKRVITETNFYDCRDNFTYSKDMTNDLVGQGVGDKLNEAIEARGFEL